MRPALVAALALASLAGQGCILFTDPVNQPPTIEIVKPNAPSDRGKPIELTANASDPDGDPPRIEWSWSAAACPLTKPDPADRPSTIYQSPPGTAKFSFTLDPSITTTACVWALAVDAHGATAVDTQMVSTENRAPVAVIKVLAPTAQTSGGRYELYSAFHLSGLESSDPDEDELTPVWELVAPPTAAPTPTLAPCPGEMPSDFVQCFDAGGFPGDYKLKLTVGDGIAFSDATLTLVVDNDHPACIKAAVPRPETSPLVLDPAKPKTFSIAEILDDGAPLPTPADGAHAAPSFAWKVRRNMGAWQPIVGYENIAALTLPGGSYATGDVVDVSVTISDGVAVHLQPACDPQCPAGCPQSAQWGVEYR